jgi:hypothetical protein
MDLSMPGVRSTEPTAQRRVMQHKLQRPIFNHWSSVIKQRKHAMLYPIGSVHIAAKRPSKSQQYKL